MASGYSLDPVYPQISRPFIVSEIMNITKETAWQVQLMSIDPQNRYYIYTLKVDYLEHYITLQEL